jgi:AraC family transcriptional regulator, melibiose operon regulatory protein
VAQMARYIANHRAQTMPVMEAADAAGMHPGYATTIFRRTLGLTINQYVVRRRLMVAQMLLVANLQDIATLADSPGFGSVSRFHSAFRHEFGTSATAFRGQPLGSGA